MRPAPIRRVIAKRHSSRSLSIKIAQRMIEFLLSSAAADAGVSTSPQQQEAARAESAAPKRAGERASGYQEHHQAGAAGTTRIPSPAPIQNKPWETYRSGDAVYNEGSDGGVRGRRSPLEDGGCCGSPGGERESDRVLRTMGGGYLLVTVLCTLSRALPAPGTKAVSDTSSISEAPSAAVVDDHRNPSRVSKHFGVAEEVAGLWLLLASLISMGAPSLKVTVLHRSFLSGNPCGFLWPTQRGVLGATATTNPLELASSLSRGSGSGTIPKSFATPPLRPRLRSVHSERMVASTPQGPALRGDGDGSRSRFEMGTSKTSQPTTAVEPRISMEAFETCGGGNFAVFLAVRWNSSNGGNGCGESGFEMLARLVLENAECTLLTPPSRRPIARDGMLRKGEGGIGQGRKDPIDRKTLGSRGLSSLLVGGPGLPSSGWRGKGVHRNSTNTRKWWTSGEDVVRRRKSNGRFWNTARATRSNSSFDSTSCGDGVGRGGSVFSTVEAAEKGRQLSVLLTGLVRDYFLSQVKALLEGHRPELHTSGVDCAPCSNSQRSSTRGPGQSITRMGRLGDAASSLARRTSKSIVSATPSDELNQLSPRSSSIREGAALAYQVAAGDVDVPGVPSKSRGSEALVEAGMVATLMRISRSTTPRPSSVSAPAEQESGPSSRLLALACLGIIAAECSIEDDTAAAPVRGLDSETKGSSSHKYDAEVWGWDGPPTSDGPVVLLSQAVELARLFMDVMTEGMASCGTTEAVAEEDEGEELADRSITALDQLLRACENHDWELETAGTGLPGGTDGAHGVVVDAIRSHSGYPSLELMVEATTAAASNDESAWRKRGDAEDQKQPPPQQKPGLRNRARWWSHHFGGGETDKKAAQSTCGGLDEIAPAQDHGHTRVADVENLVDRVQPPTERQPLVDAEVGAGATGLSSRNSSSKWQARIFPRD